MKKSSVFSNKSTTIKDISNSISAFTVITLTLFVIFMIVGTLAPATNVNNKLVLTLSEQLARKMYSYSFVVNDIDAIPFIIPLVVALFQFSFLHQKDYCYTFLSFSIKRKNIYRNRMLIPLLAMIISVFIIKGIALGLNLQHLHLSADIIEAWLIHITIHLQIIIFVYSITVFCCHMCGRTVEALAASLSFLILPFALTNIIGQVFYFSLYGYRNTSDDLLSKVINLINPIPLDDYAASGMKTAMELPTNLSARLITSLIWIGISIGLLVYTQKYFEKNYKPEISGFKGAKAGIVYVISVSAPLLIAYFGMDFVRSYYYPFTNTQVKLIALLSSLFFGLLGAVLCNFIIHFTFKRIKIALLAGASIGIVTGIVVLIAFSGIFGTYNKIPEPDEIQSVSVSHPFHNFAMTETASVGLDNYFPESSGTFTFTNEDEIQLVTDIHKQVLEDRKAESVTVLIFSYTLNDGSVVEREYKYLSNSALEKSLELWDTPTVKNYIKGHIIPEKVFKPAPDTTQGHTTTVYNTSSSIQLRSKYNVTTDISSKLASEQSSELRNAIQKDIFKLNHKEWFKPTSELLGTIILSTSTSEHLEYEQYNYSNHFELIVPVYENMENTLNVLKKYNLIDILTAKRNITKLYISDFRSLVEWYGNASDELQWCGNTTEPKISDYLIMPYFNNMNFISLQHIPTNSDAPIKEITDKKEIEKYITDGQSYYLIGNNDATYILAEFEGDKEDERKGNVFIIPNT